MSVLTVSDDSSIGRWIIDCAVTTWSSHWTRDPKQRHCSRSSGKLRHHLWFELRQQMRRYEPMDSITLRKAGPDDSGFAYCAKRAAFREYVQKVWGWDEDEQRRLHEQRFEAQDFRVINLAGTDVGIMALVVAPDCVKVNQLFLLPEHQGNCIGRECMALVMAEARQLGVPVRLRVLKVNPRAQAFFQSLGFVATGQSDTHVLMQRDS